MPNIIASNFTLFDSQNGGPPTTADIKLLNQALDYLNSVAPGSALLNDIAQNSQLTINFVHTGAVSDQYGGNGRGTTGSIDWDPNAGLNVAAEQNGVSNTSDSASPGTESAALALAHEFAHADDPNFVTNLDTNNPQYGNDADEYAAQVVNSIASPLGEPERFSHTAADDPSFSEATSTTSINNVFNASGTIYRLRGGERDVWRVRDSGQQFPHGFRHGC
jgi:hypothetical protein